MFGVVLHSHLEMCFIFQSCLLILSLLKNLHKIWVAMWFLILLIVVFQDQHLGRRLDVLRNGTGYTTLRHQANHPYLLFLSTTFLKKKFGFIIVGVDIRRLVARSSAETEFRAMAQGVCVPLCLNIILEDLKIKWDDPMWLYCNNKFAINVAHNLV